MDIKNPDPQPPEGPAPEIDPQRLREMVVTVLRTVYDPEIPVNIYELGLIYSIDIDKQGAVQVRMTLTSPGCPVAGTMPGEVEAKVRAIPGVRDVQLELVWEPPWDMNMISEEGRLVLGL